MKHGLALVVMRFNVHQNESLLDLDDVVCSVDVAIGGATDSIARPACYQLYHSF